MTGEDRGRFSVCYCLSLDTILNKMYPSVRNYKNQKIRKYSYVALKDK